MDLVVHVHDRKFNDRRYFIDCSKLLALGWTEQVSWKEGLKETIDWYSRNDQNSGYWGNLSSALIAHPTGGKPTQSEEGYLSSGINKIP
jgi:dTDP-D-glucose 4,6-dehydratase